MEHRKVGFAIAGVAAAGLCAVVATTALASSGHGTAPHTVKRSRSVVKETARPKTASADRTQDQPSEENRRLLKIRKEIKATTAGPTKAQVTEADKLVGQLKAQGQSP